VTAVTHGELFAGMGGFGLGFAQAGIATLWHAEIEPAARAVLAHHWPGVPLLEDVRTVKGGDLEPVNVISFGSPCQDLSVAGKREGLAGERSGLFFEATRIIREMREATDDRFPGIAIWENVPGALSSRSGRDFGAALNALADCGSMDIAWRIINAEHWVPQRRRRVFVVAGFSPFALGDTPLGRSGEILAFSEGSGGHLEEGGAARQEVAGTFGGGSGDHGWQGDTNRMTFIPPISPRLSAKWAKGTGGPAGDEAQNLVPAAWGVRMNHPSANGRAEKEELAHTLEAGVSQAVAFVERTRNGSRNLETQAEVFYALTNPGKGGRTDSRQLMQGTSVRRLTPLECLRLQGFPDDWLSIRGMSDGKKYQLCGNAVAVPVARWLGERILAVLAEA
jgi:DNA (cytosine-5)-methyltransferase 1